MAAPLNADAAPDLEIVPFGERMYLSISPVSVNSFFGSPRRGCRAIYLPA